MRRALKLNVLVFVLLFTATLPFPLYFIQHPAFGYESFFIACEQKTYALFGLKAHFQGHLYSDSPDLLLHVFFLLLITPLFGWLLLKIKSLSPELTDKLYLNLIAYILAFFLVKYGFDKVFKLQFYAPEPNILHTPFGALDKDILYWSTVGKSYSYSVFTGTLEVIAGVLLLFRQTRKMGALAAFAVMLHVLMINISYGIEVKILSSYLLLLSLLLILWYRRELLAFFSGKREIHCRTEPEIKLHFRLKRLIRFCLVFYLFFESTFLAFSTGNFNDDQFPRPAFHGSYELLSGKRELEQALGLNKKLRIRRLFIHRQSYLVVQTTDDRFLDFAFRYLPGQNGIRLRNAAKTEFFFVKMPLKKRWKLEFREQNKPVSLELEQLEF